MYYSNSVENNVNPFILLIMALGEKPKTRISYLVQTILTLFALKVKRYKMSFLLTGWPEQHLSIL